MELVEIGLKLPWRAEILPNLKNAPCALQIRYSTIFIEERFDMNKYPRHFPTRLTGKPLLSEATPLQEMESGNGLVDFRQMTTSHLDSFSLWKLSDANLATVVI